ncbi:hypothetical protein EJ08DRAFT_52688 [Tothia fuscella]|uniref:Uncharacterized protein n=1 Tax=Tothia fuscella TaxID=1048955 RepID=A0A9P4TT72_9PEZI|nr:hypothetical protein EJ08DRAFT_52688 [Tothia fuscella]
MAGIRDPAFWRRFSMAVHLDEERGGHAATPNNGAVPASPTSTRPSLKHSDTWLDRQNAKKSRRTCICWIFWLCFFCVTAGVVIVVLWLKASGILSGKKDAV